MPRTYENELRDQAKILSLLDAVEEIVGRVNFQKIVYLLQRNQKLFDYDFIWWYHGPYSKDLVSDIDTLVMSSLVEEDIKQEDDKEIYRYRLTSRGKEVLYEVLSDDQQLRNLLRLFLEGKQQIKNIGFNNLVNYVYELLECKLAKKKGIGTKIDIPR